MSGDEPLLFPGQQAEWVTLHRPMPEEIRDSWIVRAVLQSPPPVTMEEADGGLICAGPGCERILRAGDRVVLLTKQVKSLLMKMWFCSMECQRKNHAAVRFMSAEDDPRSPGQTH